MIDTPPAPVAMVVRWADESSSTASPLRGRRTTGGITSDDSTTGPLFTAPSERPGRGSSASSATETDERRDERLSRTVRDGLFGRISREDAAERLFPYLFEGTLFQRREARSWLRRLGAADTILQLAIASYRIHGGEDTLTEAASLLADQGPASWPALRGWAERAGAEGEAFVGVVARLPNVPEQERLEALKQLAHNGDESTRLRVLEAAWDIPEASRHALLIALASEEGADDSVRSEAQALLATGEDRQS